MELARGAGMQTAATVRPPGKLKVYVGAPKYRLPALNKLVLL
jgi:hypothetical protein